MATIPKVNPLGYQGVHSTNPPMLWFRDRDPDMVTFKDWRNYTIGDEWQNTVTKQFFKLVSTPTGQGVWDQLTHQVNSSFAWYQISAGQTLLRNSGDIVDGPIPSTRPGSSIVGDRIVIIGLTGGWTLNYGVNQIIHFFKRDTTISTGSLASTNAKDTIVLVCTADNTEWSALSSGGNITVL